MDTEESPQTVSAAPTMEELLALTARQDAVEGASGSTIREKANLPAAARRALEEAEERRRNAETQAMAKATPKEIGGRGGADPARYGDWEIDGRAIDF